MKKINSGVWFFLWALITIILVLLSAKYMNRSLFQTKPAGPIASSSSLNGLTLNMAEIAKHNSASDCWLLINNKVYDVTAAISSHPGGAGPILAHCGQEATQAFNTKDIGRPHSANAMSQLAAYFIGNFNQTIGQAQIQQNIQQTNTVVPTTRGGEDDGGDS